MNVGRDPTTPKLKTSDLGVTFPRSASGAMYAFVPTILSVIMVVDVRLAEALVRPKSEILATSPSSSRMFALGRQTGHIFDNIQQTMAELYLYK